LLEEFVSLAGTNRNCAGGKTPWGSWISCEEEISTPQMNQPNNPNNVSVKHGYNFEVPSQGKIAQPIPLIAMGRFRHEAIAVDPKTGYIYQTEDQKDGCFYRFRPKETNNLSAGGILEALVIKDRPGVDTSLNYPLNQPKSVEWIRLEDIDPQEDTLRYEAQKKGAAIFKRGEGICLGKGEIYFTCTSGGKAEKGQVFRYNPVQETIALFVESPGEGVLDYPDNLVLSPFGDLVICEDGAGEQFLVGVTPTGNCYHLARNALNNSEFAGVCFSPDGKTLFVNIYSPGLTLAVWGNWN
jgi:secreted PhoX family phosphatase